MATFDIISGDSVAPVSKRPRLDHFDSPHLANENRLSDLRDDFDDIYDDAPNKSTSQSHDIALTAGPAEPTSQDPSSPQSKPSSFTFEIQPSPQRNEIDKETTETATRVNDSLETQENGPTTLVAASGIPGLSFSSAELTNFLSKKKEEQSSTQQGVDDDSLAAFTKGTITSDEHPLSLPEETVQPAIPGLSYVSPVSNAQDLSSEKRTLAIDDSSLNSTLIENAKSGEKDEGPPNVTEVVRGDGDLSEDSFYETQSAQIEPTPLNEAPGPKNGIDGEEREEFRFDSSDLSSSSASSSSTEGADESEDDDEEDTFKLLGPEEQARLLMQGDGDSDDEGGLKSATGMGGPLRTKNEVVNTEVEKPSVTITEDMAIEELGQVESVIDSLVLIKAKISGEYRVLDEGSVLCLGDRSVIGVVAELLGRVQMPRYSVRFNNREEIASTGLEDAPLQKIKGSDASNIHDEEPAEHELEFSDDEAEQAHRRQLKQRRQGRNQPDQYLSDVKEESAPLAQQSRAFSTFNEEVELNYDETSTTIDDDLYTPLTRPKDYHQLMQRPPVSLNSDQRRGRGGRISGKNRGDLGRGRGSGHGGRRNDRPGRNDRRRANANQGQSRNQFRHSEDTGSRHIAKTAEPFTGSQYTPIDERGHEYQAFIAPRHRQDRVMEPRPSKLTADSERLVSAQTRSRTPTSYLSYPPQYEDHPRNGKMPFYPEPSPAPHPHATAFGPVYTSQAHSSLNTEAPEGAYINPAFYENQRTSSATAGWNHSSTPQKWNHSPQVGSPPSWQSPQIQASTQWHSTTPIWDSHPRHARDPVGPAQHHIPLADQHYHYQYARTNAIDEFQRTSPEAEAASRAADEKLEILRRFSRTSGSP